MANYVVKWEIDIEADDPVEAARQALEVHRDPESLATYFVVCNTKTGVVSRVDLHELDNRK